ncbi:MAG: hypothetical protein ABUL49_00125, partial [bacterium]
MIEHRAKFISFDAAQTLIRVDWDPRRVALQAVAMSNLECDEQVAAEIYMRLLQTRWADYKLRNRSRDYAQVEAWWWELVSDWSRQMGWPEASSETLFAAAEQLLHGEGNTSFVLFDDTLPCLRALTAAGTQCGVVSNWDMSLHRYCKDLGIAPYV